MNNTRKSAAINIHKNKNNNMTSYFTRDEINRRSSYLATMIATSLWGCFIAAGDFSMRLRYNPFDCRVLLCQVAFLMPRSCYCH